MKGIKEQLQELIDGDYEAFVKALISVETSIEDEEKLDKAYSDYMRNDYAPLISEDILNSMTDDEEKLIILKEFSFGTISGRHDMPVDKFVFEHAISDPFDFFSMALETDIFYCKYDKEIMKADIINIYVTGLTSALIVILHSGMKRYPMHQFNLMHYNAKTNNYEKQKLGRSWFSNDN